MSAVIERLELTDEIERGVRGHSACSVDWHASLLSQVAAALPEPSLRERAYKVVYPRGNYRESTWVMSEATAVGDMARWLFENAWHRPWFVQQRTFNTWRSGYREGNSGSSSTLVDAYARTVVGLGEKP